jgi:hypothetical protein
MNNEPVAFMHKTIPSWVSTFIYPETEPDEWLPLYTHPVKELTDEEIEKVRIAIMNTAYWCADENMAEAYNAIKVCCSEVLAILRKAQEK